MNSHPLSGTRDPKCGHDLFDHLEEEDEADGVELFEAHFDASHRALAVHEAGHGVVARALGAEVLFIEIDLMTGDGKSRSSDFDDPIKNLAVCVAGCRAEHAFEARKHRRAKIGDYRTMRRMISQLPEADRRAARASAYRLADATLKDHAAKVQRVTDELMARRWRDGTDTVRIQDEELIKLLDG